MELNKQCSERCDWPNCTMEGCVVKHGQEPNKQPPVTIDEVLAVVRKKSPLGNELYNALDSIDKKIVDSLVTKAAARWAEIQTKDKDALIAQLREEVARYKSNCDAYIKVVEQLQQENQRLREGFMNQRPE